MDAALHQSVDQLLERTLRSDKEAFGLLYEAMVTPLSRYLIRMSGSKQLAMDVIHDTFVHLWSHRQTIQVHKSGQALLYTMVRNRYLNQRKREARSQSLSDEMDLVRAKYTSSLSDSSGDKVDRDSLASNIVKWIGMLPPRRAEAFLLSRYHALSHEEISRIMDLSERTVNTHIHHALKSLRAHLNDFQKVS